MRLFLALTACAAGLLCVNYPLETERDLYEMESVWQYLKVYSIWQERVPRDAFQYDSPEAMLLKIMDTLKGPSSYTRYDSSCGACRASVGRIDGQTEEDTNDLHWTPLTDSTMLVRIAEFSESTYRHFVAAVVSMDALHPFKNIIFDLRFNGGGDIKSTDSIINAILPQGTPYLIETYREYDEINRTAKTVEGDTQVTSGPQHWALRGKRYALLVNKGTASASEMLITALKEGFSKVGKDSNVVIIGDTTYGKGIGQICIPRHYLRRNNLKITFMRMKGLDEIGDYHVKGIAPDVYSSEQLLGQATKALSFFHDTQKINGKTLPNLLEKSVQFPAEAIARVPSDDRPLGGGS
jgi:hypothetical protein